MTTIINASTSAGLISTADTSGILQLQTANTTALTVDASQNVGVGTASPGFKFDVNGTFGLGTGQTGNIGVFGANTATGDTYFKLRNTAGAFDIGTSATGHYFYGQGSLPLQFFTNATERARIDTSGNLGIGTSSPYARIQGFQSSSTLPVNWIYRGTQGLDNNLPTTYGFPYLQIGRVEYRLNSLQTIGFGYVGADGRSPPAEIGYISTSISGETFGDLVFATRSVTTNTAASERARIDSSGNLLVGTTSTVTNGGIKVTVDNGATGNTLIAIGHKSGTASGEYYNIFYYGSGVIGSITQSGTTAVAYNTSSDYRLKNTIAPMTGALAKVALLKPCTYKWNADGSDGQGFIAHELAEVVPDCVTGEKDAVDAEGNPKYQGIDTSFLVATLTAAIQELKAEFDAYKASHP